MSSSNNINNNTTTITPPPLSALSRRYICSVVGWSQDALEAVTPCVAVRRSSRRRGTELLSISPTYKARIKASHLIHHDDTHPARLPFAHYNTPIHMLLKRPNSGRYTFLQKAGGLFDRAGPRPVALAIGRSAILTPTSIMLDLEASAGRNFVVPALEQVIVLLPVWCGRAVLL